MLLTPDRRNFEVEQISGPQRVGRILSFPKYRTDPATGLLTAVNDPLWVPGANGSHECTNNTFHAFFSQWFDDANLWTFRTDPLQDDPDKRGPQPTELVLSAESLNWVNDAGQSQTIATPQHVGADRGKNQINYAGAFGPGLDMRWSNSPDRLKKDLVIASRGSLPNPTNPVANGTGIRLQLLFKVESFQGDLNLDGVTWDKQTTARGTRAFLITGGLSRFGLAAPYALSGDMLDPGPPSQELQYVFLRKGANVYVGVECPIEYLDAASYPVEVDLVEEWGEHTGSDYTGKFFNWATRQDFDNSITDGFHYYVQAGWQTYVQVDLSDLTGSETINSVSLNAYAYRQSGSFSRPIYEILRTLGTGAKWTEYSTGNSWTTAGGRGEGTDVDTSPTLATMPSQNIGDQTGNSANWQVMTSTDGSGDFATFISNNLGGTINLKVHASDSGSGFSLGRGNTYSDADFRPWLEIDYTVGGGATYTPTMII